MRLVALIGHVGYVENDHMYNMISCFVPLIVMIKNIFVIVSRIKEASLLFDRFDVDQCIY